MCEKKKEEEGFGDVLLVNLSYLYLSLCEIRKISVVVIIIITARMVVVFI